MYIFNQSTYLFSKILVFILLFYYYLTQQHFESIDTRSPDYIMIARRS